MRRVLLLLPALAGFGAPAFADDPLPHYVRTGSDLACQQEAGKTAANDTPCLAIGDVQIGMRRSRIEFRLGKPVQTIEADGRTYYGYALNWSNAGQALNASHQVLTSAMVSYDAQGTADSLQIAGEPWDGAWRFCGLTLGDSASALRTRLGEPLQTGPGDAGATVLSYGPSVAIGLRNDRISSIRIAKSGA
jgi:hypothetical protein